ncbi:MAG: hypothetical protein J7M06_02730, partial [Proteobacteria bacterium]|nr:hypothetical protein [Pseudomonadota bacterium]
SINSKTKSIFRDIMKRYKISALYVFGSRAPEFADRIGGESVHSSHQLESDLDIGIQPIKGVRLSVRKKVSLTIELEDFFEAPRIDLVVISEADPFLSANIIRGERIYCKDKNESDNYELYLLRRAGDLIPLERERISLILGDEK